MIFQCRIGDYESLLDDEMSDSRPTPEHAADYLTRCAQIVLGLYVAGAEVDAPTTD